MIIMGNLNPRILNQKMMMDFTTVIMAMILLSHHMEMIIISEIQEIMDLHTLEDLVDALKEEELKITHILEIIFHFDFIASIIL